MPLYNGQLGEKEGPYRYPLHGNAHSVSQMFHRVGIRILRFAKHPFQSLQLQQYKEMAFIVDKLCMNCVCEKHLFCEMKRYR